MVALVSERTERGRAGVELPHAARIPVGPSLWEHLLGPDHRLPASLLSSPGGEDWLRAVHVTHHGAPYPPAVPHPL